MVWTHAPAVVLFLVTDGGFYRKRRAVLLRWEPFAGDG